MKNFLSEKAIAQRLLAGLGAIAICFAPFPAIAKNTENILLDRALFWEQERLIRSCLYG
jgi:hypothetical protein